MNHKLPLCGALLLALAGGAIGQTPRPGQKLTEEELLRQIESFNPSSTDPLKKAPASVAEIPAAARAAAPDTKILSERVAATGALADPDEPKPRKPKGATEITADAVDFDQKTHRAIFTGNVVVKDPEFDLQCDKLTAILKNDKSAGNGSKPPAPEGAAKKKSGGLEKAIAEGNVIISQDKLDPDGSVTKSTGRAQRADYSATTGEMILSGSPEVQQGINTCVATDPGTRMFMQRDGKMRVEGPSKMVIRDQGDSK